MSLRQTFRCIRIVSNRIFIDKCDIHIEIIPMAKEKHAFKHDETITTYLMVYAWLYVLQLLDISQGNDS